MRTLRPRTALALLAPGCLLLLASAPVTTAKAAVPTTVDSYGGNAFASAVHVIVGSNNDTNFSQGAIGNRYPLTQVSQDVAPASQATASLNDLGPLVQTVAGTDCGAPPPWPLPPPFPNPVSGHYCLETIRENAPYARAQYPNPPGVPDQSVTGPGGAGLFGLPAVPPGLTSAVGTATAHAAELSAKADGVYNGTAPVAQVAISNASAHSETKLAADGTLTVTTHSTVASACFGNCDVSNYLVVTHLDVVTKVTAVAGKALTTATVIPGQIMYCIQSSSCQPVQVDSGGVTVGLPVAPPSPPPAPSGVPPFPGLGQQQGVSLPGLGGSGDSTFFHLRTVAPNQQNNNGIGTVDALGLDIAVTQPGKGDSGVPNSTVEYILGEGHADGFSIAAVPFNDVSSPISSVLAAHLGGYSATAPLSGGGSSNHTRTIRTRSPSLGLAGAFRPPFTYLFYGWEASVLAAAGSLIWARRRKLDEDAE
jgi:hypothetical protein